MKTWLRHKNWGVMLWLAVVVLIGFNVIVAEHLAVAKDHRLELVVLDVGQGDSMLVRSPDGKYGLIDGGRGKQVISQLAEHLPPLQRRLEFVIGTHPDADHIEGLLEVMKQYEVGAVFWERNQKSNTITKALDALIAEKRIPVYELDAEDDFDLGCCVRFDVIWPLPGADTKAVAESNDVSLSLIIRYKLFQMYAAGDLPANLEEQAIATLPEGMQRVDVFKVSHHGSKHSTSANLLSRVDTQVGLISVGKSNSYGHPAMTVLSNLEAAHVEVIRTDLEGAITLTTDGQVLDVKTANRVEKFVLKD